VDAKTRSTTSLDELAARLSVPQPEGNHGHDHHTPALRHHGAHPAPHERRRRLTCIFLAHAPALIKINGQCVPINSQTLPSDAPQKLLAEVLSPLQIEELEREGELNVGFPLAGVGRFRVSAMRQRGTIAAVIRYISVDVPPAAQLAAASGAGRPDGMESVACC